MKINKRIDSLMLFIILFVAILPITNIGSFAMPPLYLLLPILVFLLVLFILRLKKIPPILLNISLIFLMIFSEVLLSNINGTIKKTNDFIFPSDAIQYVARFIYIMFFAIATYKGKIKADIFIKYFLLFLNIGMLIGILQWIPWGGRELFIKLYPFRDGVEQLSQLNRPIHLIRVHGMAQHATANGGLASFFFIFGYSVYKYYSKHKSLSVLLIILSLTNIFASQARAGLLALGFSIFLFYIIDMHFNKRSYKSTLYFLVGTAILLAVIIILYQKENPFISRMIYRWEALFETKGGGRIEQVKYFMSMFSNPMDYILGLSKNSINNSDISYGVEIELVNIFLTYGVVGVILQYLLIFVLLFYFYKKIKQNDMNKESLTLLISSFVGLLSYQVFSVAYFFYKEIRVGHFPWILMGVAIGFYEKCKRDKIKNENSTYI
jgi:hypothetical protein